MGDGRNNQLRILATPSGHALAKEVSGWLSSYYLPRRDTEEEPIPDIEPQTAFETALLNRVQRLEQQRRRSAPRSPLEVTAEFSRFGDGDSKVYIPGNVRGDHVVVIADCFSHAAPEAMEPREKRPGYKVITGSDIQVVRNNEAIDFASRKGSINDNFSELCGAIDAARGSNAAKVTVLTPCTVSGRQDRRLEHASYDLMLRLKYLAAAGANHLLVVDAHSTAVDTAREFGMGLERLRTINTTKRFLEQQLGYRPGRTTIVSPDYGANNSTKALANELGAKSALVDKSREEHTINTIGASAGLVEGRDYIEGYDCIIPDDMIDTAGTIGSSAAEVHRFKPNSITLLGTHAIFSYPAMERLDSLVERGIVNRVIITNSITLHPDMKRPYLHEVNISKYLAKVIDGLDQNHSLRELVVTD